MKRALLFLAALLACAGAFATPTDIAAEYQLSAAGLTIGHVSETFARQGDEYQIRSVASSSGVLKLFLDDALTMQSSGRIVASGLQPLAFAQHRSRTDKGAVKATFDWEHGVMHSESGDTEHDVPLPQATQDRISVMYQFMNLKPGAKTVEMYMSNGRKVERYTYRYVARSRWKLRPGRSIRSTTSAS